MKIRTDFVTNSSSSSFVSYRFNTKLLNEFLKEHGMKPYSAKDKMEYIESSSDEAGYTYDSLGQAVLVRYSGKDYYELDEEMDIWGMNGGNSEDYKTHKWQNEFDGTEESALNVLQELFEHTDFERHLDFTRKEISGGGEMYSDTLLGLTSSGYSMATYNGLITDYDAHTYEGGFGYDTEASKYIEYYDKTLKLYDAHSGTHSDNDVIWTNEKVSSAMNTLFRQSEGIDIIEYFEFSQVDRIDIPAKVKIVKSEALTNCENLKVLYVLGYDTKLEDNAVNQNVEIIAHEGSAAEQYAQKHGNKFTVLTEYRPLVFSYREWEKHSPRNYAAALEKYAGKFTCKTKVIAAEYNSEQSAYNTILTPDSFVFAEEKEEGATVYDKYLVNATYRKVLTGTFPYGEAIYFANKDTEIEPDGVAKSFHVYVLGHGKVEEYAKTNGNQLTIIPDTVAANTPYKLENNILSYSRPVEFSIRGLTEAKKKKMKDKDSVEIIHDGEDHLNSLRVAFILKDINECVGVMSYTISSMVAYLMDKGYIVFENPFIWKGNVSTNMVLNYPLGEKLSYMLHSYELHRKYIPEYLESVMQSEAGNYTRLGFDSNDHIRTYFLFRLIDCIYGVDKTEKSLKKLSEPHNRLADCYSGAQNRLVAFRCESLNKYVMENDYHIVKLKNGKLYIDDDEEPIKGNELDFAKVFINHYNRLYGLAELDFDAKEED